MNEPMILHPEQAEDLRRLLGTVEDWLLHASFEVLDELGGFLTGLSWGCGASPERVVGGRATDLRSRRRNHHPPNGPGPGVVVGHDEVAVNELISTRIRDHATRLVLPHLAEKISFEMNEHAEVISKAWLSTPRWRCRTTSTSPRASPSRRTSAWCRTT